jgi:hypothetical protein
VKIYLSIIAGEQQLVGLFEAEKVPALVAFFLEKLSHPQLTRCEQAASEGVILPP